VIIMAVHTVRRLAAEILNVGENRIKINSDSMSEVLNAMTRADVKTLIDKGVVKAAPKKGRKKIEKKKRRGRGSRKGKTAGQQKKEWMQKVRSQRKLLRKLIALEALEKDDKRYIYLKIKSGIFRNKHAMMNYLKENDFIAKDLELPKEEYVPKKKPKKEKKEEKKEEAKKPEEKKGETK